MIEVKQKCFRNIYAPHEAILKKINFAFRMCVMTEKYRLSIRKRQVCMMISLIFQDTLQIFPYNQPNI